MVVVTPLCVSHLAIRTGQMRNGLTQDDGRINAARYKRLFKCDIAGRDKPARRSHAQDTGAQTVAATKPNTDRQEPISNEP